MKILVLRSSKCGTGWRLRFMMEGSNLLTTVIIGASFGPTADIPLREALDRGAKEARENFADMLHFNSKI